MFNGCFDELDGGFEFFQGFVVIDPVAGVLGDVAHHQVDAAAICAGAVQQGFKGVAAFVGDPPDAQAGRQGGPGLAIEILAVRNSSG